MINKRQEPLHATTIGWQDYEIIDSGNAQKLERFGALKLTRFEPQAVWKPALPLTERGRSLPPGKGETFR
jgi:23S rRNA (cytosine1962-C5)-methyltransferase